MLRDFNRTSVSFSRNCELLKSQFLILNIRLLLSLTCNVAGQSYLKTTGSNPPSLLISQIILFLIDIVCVRGRWLTGLTSRFSEITVKYAPKKSFVWLYKGRPSKPIP